MTSTRKTAARKTWNPQPWQINPDTVTFPNSIYSLYRDDYTAAEYRETYRAACKHYGYKARVVGGWMFFEFITDYETWKAQR